MAPAEGSEGQLSRLFAAITLFFAVLTWGDHRVPDARAQKKTHISRRLRGLVRVDVGLTAASIAVLAVEFSLNSAGTFTMEPDSIEMQTGPETKLVYAAATEGASEPDGAGATCASFDARFYFDQQSDSFDERFASAFGSAGNTRRKTAAAGEGHDEVPLQQSDRSLVTQSIMTPVTAARHASLREEQPDSPEASMSSRPFVPDSHTAIYDIAARTVYLPDGHRLEAHSGLGNRLDDPRFIRTKMQGPTPPNVYNLSLRERLFHGVRAIRLVPVDDGKMFGRDGILAHSYMLGPNGQSNGCVSFRNYPAFLNAFLKGDVNRLVVVEHLATTTGAKVSSANGG
jgi:hypothetical protein